MSRSDQEFAEHMRAQQAFSRPKPQLKLSQKPPPMSFSRAIKRKRIALGLTQSQVAAKLGLKHVAVLHWEKGQTIPRLDHAMRLAEVLGMELKGFTFGERA